MANRDYRQRELNSFQVALLRFAFIAVLGLVLLVTVRQVVGLILDLQDLRNYQHAPACVGVVLS